MQVTLTEGCGLPLDAGKTLAEVVAGRQPQDERQPETDDDGRSNSEWSQLRQTLAHALILLPDSGGRRGLLSFCGQSQAPTG